MEGIVCIDKPEGWTSFDVVNYVRKMVAQKAGKKPKHIKVGHSGTLDPKATGLLLLCVGKKFTTQMSRFTKLDKTYVAEITLGQQSSTDDSEGELETISSYSPDEAEVHRILSQFVGETEQTPPAFSAIKIDGKRAYALARKGDEVSIKSRLVRIYSIEDITYNYPVIRCQMHVGSGTYIRSVARDVGEKLGCGAYLSNLRRTHIAHLSVESALAVSELSVDTLEKHLKLTDVDAIIQRNNDRNEEYQR